MTSVVAVSDETPSLPPSIPRSCVQIVKEDGAALAPFEEVVAQVSAGRAPVDDIIKNPTSPGKNRSTWVFLYF